MKTLFMEKVGIKTLALSVILMSGLQMAYANADFDPRPPVDPQYHYYYPVTTSVSPEGAGRASGGGKFEAGTNLWLNTSASYGYVFSHWEKDGVFYTNQQSFNYTLGEERPVFVAVYEYKPNAPSDPQNNYEPKKRLYLTCEQAGCSFNLTSGERRVIGKTLNIQAYLDPGYVVKGWYEGDSLVATTSGFNYVMPDHDATLRVDIEYNPMIPGDPVSVGGDIALEADNLDDIDPYVPNSLFYFEKTAFTYTGKPLALGYYSRLNPVVESLDELGTEVGSYTARIDVTIKNDSIDTHKAFNFSYTIVPAELTASAGNYTRVYGADNPELTVSYKGFVNGETTSVLTTVPQISTTAVKQSPVGEYDVEVSAGTAKNYTIKTKNGKLVVNKAPIVITPNDVEVTYGDDLSNHTFSYSVQGFMNGDTVDCFTANPVIRIDGDGINAGTYAIVASGASADNYSISYEPGTLTVKKAPMTITVANAARVYGAANPTFSYTALDNAGKDVLSALSTKPTMSTDATVLSVVGEYTITAVGAESTNYAITVVDGTLSVNKAPLTITPKNVMVEYGTDITNYAYDFTYEGFVNGDYTSSLTKLPVASIQNYKTDVGVYNLVASGAEADNYEITYGTGTFTIAQAVLTLTISDTVKVYGEENPVFEYTVKDSKGNDCLSELSVLPTFVTRANASSNVGVYDVSATGALSQNFSITVVDGHLTITKAPLKITPKNMMTGYGVDYKNLKYEFDYVGLVNGDKADCLASMPVIVLPDNINTIGEYDITAKGAQAVNYDISYGMAKLIVDKMVLTLKVTNVSREYGDENPAFEYVWTDSLGKVYDAVIALTPTLNCTATVNSGVGEYQIAASVAFDSVNYKVTIQNGVLTVNPATLTVTAYNAQYVEGTGNFDLSYHIEGFKNGENESVLTKKPIVECNADASSAHGTYVITVSGAEADNYVFTYVNGTLTLIATAVNPVQEDVVKPVYDMTGRLVGTTADEIKPGLYIIQGKKVLITE